MSVAPPTTLLAVAFACCKLVAALLPTTLLKSPVLPAAAAARVLAHFGLKYEVVAGYKNFGVAGVSQPHIWLTLGADRVVVDVGLDRVNHTFVVYGREFALLEPATRCETAFYTDVRAGPYFALRPGCAKLEAVERAAGDLDLILEELRLRAPAQSAQLLQAVQDSLNPGSPLVFSGLAKELLP